MAKWPAGCSALLDPADSFSEPVILTTRIEDEINEARLEVIDTNQQAVVTVMELLSPTNKINGSRFRASCEQKRREVMNSSSHFVEINLLREGDHLHTRQLLPLAEYYVHVSHKDRRPEGYVWPIRWPQRLPVIGIPLKEGDPDAKLDLQEVLATAYDLQVDYRSEPTPWLSPEMAEWANTLLTSKGIRYEKGWLKKQMLGRIASWRWPLTQGGGQRQLCCSAGSSRHSISHLISIAD